MRANITVCLFGFKCVYLDILKADFTINVRGCVIMKFLRMRLGAKILMRLSKANSLVSDGKSI